MISDRAVLMQAARVVASLAVMLPGRKYSWILISVLLSTALMFISYCIVSVYFASALLDSHRFLPRWGHNRVGTGY